jgi:hypothetical protein
MKTRNGMNTRKWTHKNLIIKNILGEEAHIEDRGEEEDSHITSNIVVQEINNI